MAGYGKTCLCWALDTTGEAHDNLIHGFGGTEGALPAAALASLGLVQLAAPQTPFQTAIQARTSSLRYKRSSVLSKARAVCVCGEEGSL